MITYNTFISMIDDGGFVLFNDPNHEGTVLCIRKEDGDEPSSTKYTETCIKGDSYEIGYKIRLSNDFMNHVYHYWRLIPKTFQFVYDGVDVPQNDCYTYDDWLNRKCTLSLHKHGSVFNRHSYMEIRNGLSCVEFRHIDIDVPINTGWSEIGVPDLYFHIREYSPEYCYYGNDFSSVRYQNGLL